MRKALMWIKMLFSLLPIYISARKCRKESYETRMTVIQYWCQKVLKATGAKFEVYGQDKVPTDETVYFVSNHEGSLDPFIFYAECPVPSSMVSKLENGNIPIIGTWMKTMEMVSFKREDLRASVQMVKDVTEILKSGRNIVIFPEGTRSKSLNMNEFKAGALKPAFRAKVTIVPIALKNSFLLDTNRKLETVRVSFLDPIRYEEFQDMNTLELADMIKSRIMANIAE